jgi:hypothetical protein
MDQDREYVLAGVAVPLSFPQELARTNVVGGAGRRVLEHHCIVRL